MDKSWIKEKNTFSSAYVNGVKSFINFAKQNVMGSDNLIRCPCVICNNAYHKTTDEVEYDLHINGFSHAYVDWIFHGETVHIYEGNEDDLGNTVEDIMDSTDFATGDELNELLDEMREAQQPNRVDYDETECFRQLLKDAQCALYPGCKMSLLSAIVKLLHLKVLGKWSNKSFNMLLEFLNDILPEGHTLPSTLYGARKLLVEIGLGYEEIDACKNDCALFWKENEKADNCPICKESRWVTNNSRNKLVPHKKLRYFPIKPRLQRLFMSSKIASKMRWHKERRLDEEGILRHPADSLAWKHLDKQFSFFSQDPRNVRLGLASDGFTPWSNLGNSYSMWPVILSVYNLPPYDCMRATSLIMSLLIPGPTYPGKDIDVYLQPLIEDLKDLWNVGIETYDICTKETFQMHAAVLWTISDLPAYSLLSGWVTMGHYACPCCFNQTDSKQLRTKTCYMGHRRFLHQNHSFRRNKADFDGAEERRAKPKQLCGDDILRWLNSLDGVFSKPGKHKGINEKRKRGSDQGNWVKKSIFFELPYWHKLLIRHNLDVMHIEKNICDNILGTLLDIKGKTKDPVIAREDLRDWGIREELHMQVRARDNKPIKPAACYTLSIGERAGFYQFIKSIKFPDGYAANL